MPNERRRRRAVRRVDLLPRLRAAPVLLLGLLTVAVVGQTPSSDAPIRWTVRDASGWMAEFAPLMEQRGALISAASTAAASRGDRLAVADPAPARDPSAGASPASAEAAPAPMVVADAELLPRHEVKRVPRDVVDPEVTGAVPGLRRPAVAPTEVPPVVNRAGKTDRLLMPQPIGRTTDRDLMVKPTLATVAPSADGWQPLVSVASLIAPQSSKTLPRLALAAPDRTAVDGAVVVAMVRTGPGRVATQSAVAALGERGRAKANGRPLLPPVPEAQMASANPRTQVWAQPPVPEMGYARRTADGILARFRAVLGDESEAAPQAKPLGDAEMGP